jgi:hypothetical protein
MSVRVAVWAGLLLGLSAGGCCSGRPEFVAFTPDGRELLYQDALYARSYVYHLDGGERVEFDGEVAAVDGGTERFLLRSAGRTQTVELQLVERSGGRWSVRALPALYVPEHYPVVYFRFGPRGALCSAVVYESTWAEGPSSYRELAGPGDTWSEAAIPESLRSRKPYTWKPPVGIRNWPAAYHPIDAYPSEPDAVRYGPGTSVQVSDDHRSYHRLAGPGGRFVVRVRDPDDLWRRLTLTDTHTGRRTVLLDKNDLGLDVLRRVGQFCFGLGMILTGAPNI